MEIIFFLLSSLYLIENKSLLPDRLIHVNQNRWVDNSAAQNNDKNNENE